MLNICIYMLNKKYMIYTQLHTLYIYIYYIMLFIYMYIIDIIYIYYIYFIQGKKQKQIFMENNLANFFLYK